MVAVYTRRGAACRSGHAAAPPQPLCRAGRGAAVEPVSTDPRDRGVTPVTAACDSRDQPQRREGVEPVSTGSPAGRGPAPGPVSRIRRLEGPALAHRRAGWRALCLDTGESRPEGLGWRRDMAATGKKKWRNATAILGSGEVGPQCPVERNQRGSRSLAGSLRHGPD